MSVQFGIWNFDGRPADQELLAKARSAISEHSPDGTHSYTRGSLGVLYGAFHTTKDSRREGQPHLSPRGYVMMWDGRLDNREELIPQLREELRGHPTDADIVMAAFEHWHTDCFRRVVGDWALSIWDPYGPALILAEDYAGIRHLYYSLTKERVVWSTCLAAIVRLADVRLTLNDEYIAGYIATAPEANLTPYREIQAVPPGKFITLRGSRATLHAHWAFRPEFRTRYKSDREYEEHFRSIFRQAVRRRLRSDRPILADLSGGLDSSSIVCMADDIIASREAETPRLDTYSRYDPLEPEGDERKYITIVEQKRGRPGAHVDVSQGSGPFSLDYEDFFAVPGHLGKPQGSEADRYASLKQENYRVSLSGVGGDELMGGVPDPRTQLADLVVHCHIVELARRLGAWSLEKRMPWVQLFGQTLLELLPVGVRVHLDKRAKVPAWIGRRFARRNRLACRQLGLSGELGFWLPSRRRYAHTVLAMSNQMAYAQPPRTGSQEKRYPYMDRDLVEFMVSIPTDQLLRPGERRSLMRRALVGILPPEILSRETKGRVARRPLVGLEANWEKLETLFGSPMSARMGYISQSEFQDALVMAKNGKAPQLVRLIRIVAIELWLRDLCARGIVANVGELPDGWAGRIRPHEYNQAAVGGGE